MAQAITSPTASAAHAGMLSQYFTPGTDFLIVAILVFLFLMLWMPVTREILKGIFGTLLIPGFSVIFLKGFQWTIKMARTIWDAHWILARNLYSSHKDIHPTLVDPKRK